VSVPLNRITHQEVQRLETEKHDLIFDGQQRLEQGLAVQDELDALRGKLDKVSLRLHATSYLKWKVGLCNM
jgi:hypothetical protein